MVAFEGTVSVEDLPAHRGASVSLVLFRVESAEARPPFDGEPPAEACVDIVEVSDEGLGDTDLRETARQWQFRAARESGYYFVQLRVIGIPLPASNTEWTAFPMQNGEVRPGVSVFKHGFGCSVKGPGLVVDFDFGTHGQTDGFDIGRLQAFASRRPDFYGFSSTTEMRRALAEATASGEVGVDRDFMSYVVRAG